MGRVFNNKAMQNIPARSQAVKTRSGALLLAALVIAAFMTAPACASSGRSHQTIASKNAAANIIIENRSDLSGDKAEQFIQNIRTALHGLPQYYLNVFERFKTRIIMENPKHGTSPDAYIFANRPVDIYFNSSCYAMSLVRISECLMHEGTHLVQYNDVIRQKELDQLHPAVGLTLFLCAEFFATMYENDAFYRVHIKNSTQKNEIFVRQSIARIQIGPEHLVAFFNHGVYTSAALHTVLLGDISDNPRILSESEILGLLCKYMQCKRPGIPDLSDKALVFVFEELKKCADGTSGNIFFDDDNKGNLRAMLHQEKLYFVPAIPRQTFNRFLELGKKWELLAAAKANASANTQSVRKHGGE